MRFTFTNLCYKQINIILLNQSWILIVVSTLVTVLVLKILSKKYSWNQRFPTEGVRNGENLALFVMGNIVSQGIFFLCNSTRQFKRNVTQTNCCTIISLFILPGQHYFPDRLTVRVAAGAWACGAFFLVQIYYCRQATVTHVSKSTFRIRRRRKRYFLDGRITCACKAIHGNFKERPSLYNLPKHIDLFGIR